MNRKIIAFMNSYSHGKSGGDIVFIEIAKRLKTFNKIIVTSELGKNLCKENDIHAIYKITSHEKIFDHTIGIYFLRTLKALFLKFKIKKGDILLGTSDFLPDVLPLFFLKLKYSNKAPWVQHIFHFISPSRPLPYFAQKLSLWLIKRKADLIVVDNQILKSELVKRGLNPLRIFVNYPGVDTEYLKKFIKTKNDYDAVFMAQLRPAKGVLELIDIWKIVCHTLPKAQLAIIGKGQTPLLKEIHRKISSEKLQHNIKMLGYLKNEHAYQQIKNSRIFVFPSLEEGFGLVALEAQMLGLPIVAWNLPIFEEIFPQGMIQCKKKDIRQFARNIIILLSNSQKYDYSSHQAQENAIRFSWNKTAMREANIFKRDLNV